VTGTSNDSVFRRRVFYIPGYDPMLPRRYRELYRSESAKQGAISGYTIDLKAAPDEAYYSWHLTSDIGGERTQTLYSVLTWSDIVQASMERSIPGTYLLLAQVVWIYLRTGALSRLIRLRKGPVIAAFYPVILLLLQLLLALAIGGAVAYGFGQVLHWLIAGAIGLVVAGWILVLFRRIDNRLFAYYLLHDYAFSARHLGATPPELQARLDQFAEDIAAALAENWDEVLIVGHSSGAHMGVTVLASVLARNAAPDAPPASARLGLLTLGQVVPMVSFLPMAGRLRRELHDLSRSDRLTWVDVSAPADGCTFAVCDPVAVSGAAPEKGQTWPLVLSAAFSQTLSPALYNSLKRRFFRLHFQYLCAFDRPGDYDFFQITAGPVSLGDRYAGRHASPSRIDRALSPHQDMAP